MEKMELILGAVTGVLVFLFVINPGCEKLEQETEEIRMKCESACHPNTVRYSSENKCVCASDYVVRPK